MLEKKGYSCYYCLIDMSCRGKLAKLDEKLTLMEQKVEYIEARVSQLFITIEHINIYGNSVLFNILASTNIRCICIS